MSKKNILAGLSILVVGSLLLSACSTPTATPASPTVDANLIYTQAAQTVAASVAQTDAVKPKPTATEEPQATATIDPNMAAAMTATANAVLNVSAPTNTVAAGQPTPTTQFTLASLPTATSAVVVASTPKSSTGDKAELVGQDPDDGTTVGQKDVVTVRLKFKNTGTTTWNTGYRLVYYAGEKMGLNDFNIRDNVAPGGTTELVFTLTAPSSSGSKKVIWVLQNPDGVNFYSLWLELNVQ